MMVSGETGLPLMDRCTQSGEDGSDGTTGDNVLPADPSGRLEEGSYGDEDGEIDAEDGAMELSESEQFSDGIVMNSQGSQFDPGPQEDDLQYRTDSGDEARQFKTETEQQQRQLPSANEIEVKMEPPPEEPDDIIVPINLSVETSSPTSSLPSRLPMSGSNMERYSVPISPKPYQCSVCQKAFRSIQILQKHAMTFHSRPRSSGVTTSSRVIRGKGRHGGRGHHTTQYFSRQISEEHIQPKE